MARDTLLSFARVSLLCTLATFGLAPRLRRAVFEPLLKRGLSERAVLTACVVAVHSGSYLLFNGFFALCDWRGFFAAYKLPRKRSQVAPQSLIARTWLEAVGGQILSPVPIYYLGSSDLLRRFGGMCSPLPPVSSVVTGFVGAIVVNDVGFYWAHRLAHSKALYATVHKQHHTYKGSVSVAAEYAHPLEQLFCNVLPTVAGCMLSRVHPVAFLVFLVHRLEEAYEGHSGYCFHGSWPHRIGLTHADQCAYHDFHHTANRGNYCARYVDWLWGTADAWYAAFGCRRSTERYVQHCRELAGADARDKRACH